jgi:hypothetical protein
LEVLQAVQLIVIGVLFITLVYETMQYRKYVNATRAVMGMGMGMQEGFTTIVDNLNRITQENVQLKQDSALIDQELVIVREILDLHGEKIDMKNLMKMFNRVDKLKENEDE